MEKELIAKRFTLISPLLDERQRRLYVAAEAMVLGRGGITLLSLACGISRPTITAGCKELASLVADDTAGKTGNSNRIRKAGGGRKRTVDLDPALRNILEGLIEPVTRADPESPLRWTAKKKCT